MLINLFCGCSDFYPRSPCGERPRQAGQQQQHHNISIHALLAESDRIFHVRSFTSKDISIHALLAESDRNVRKSHDTEYYFYPRSPCGERLL